MYEVDAAVDQLVGKADLIRFHVVAPVGSPVDGNNHDVTGPLHGLHPADDIVGRGVGKIGQQINAGPACRRGPARGDPAGRRPAREDEHALAAGRHHGHRPPGLASVPPGPGRPQPGTGQGVQGVRKSAAAEVEHVIVGQRADIGAGRGDAGQVARAHPVVNGLAGREVAAAGDAGLQVDHPDIWGQVLEDPQGIPPGPGKAGRPRDRPVSPLRQSHIRPRVIDVSLAQFRADRMRENLIDASTGHHVTAQEQGQQPITHLANYGSPPAQPRSPDNGQTAARRPVGTRTGSGSQRGPGSGPAR